VFQARVLFVRLPELPQLRHAEAAEFPVGHNDYLTRLKECWAE